MFGENPIRSQVLTPERLAIEDIFYTLQGEGPFSGQPALFIRLAGCNLACTFCDTQFESQADNPKDTNWHVEWILKGFTRDHRQLVVITGGEPLMQDITDLMRQLYAHGTRHIQIETAGTLWVPGLEEFIQHGVCTLVCSPKTPRLNPHVISWCKHWKYIIRAGQTNRHGLPCLGTQKGNATVVRDLWAPPWIELRREDRHRFGTIWLSPCDEHPERIVIRSISAETGRYTANQANQNHARDLCLEHGYRLSLQVHKIVGVA